jgi:hypothetical protein
MALTNPTPDPTTDPTTDSSDDALGSPAASQGRERPTLYDLPVVRRETPVDAPVETGSDDGLRDDGLRDDDDDDDGSDGLDIAQMRTAVLVRPEVQATVTWQLFTFADRHQQEARRLTRQANDVLQNIEDMRATLGHLIARADVIWQVEAEWRTAEQRDQLDYLSAQMLRLEAEIARWRGRVIALRQDAKIEEARAIVCRRAAASSDRY